MKNYFSNFTILFLFVSMSLSAQQLPNSSFEDWSGEEYDGNIQPKSWHYSNVTQFGYKFNFAQRASGYSGYCMKVQDQSVGAAGITEVSPGYISLGQPWVYIESLTKVSQATAGTYGGIAWTHRPDTMAVWVKRTGDNTSAEDFHLLYYAWSGTAKGSMYKGKDGGCTSVEQTNEESDIRQSLDGNECGSVSAGHQIAEGWVYGRKTYNQWTLIKIPIYYIDNTIPEKVNVIFSASNYPNFRANSGLYDGNSLFVDELQLIYSSKIQQLIIGGDEWKAFNPNSTAVQTYVLEDGVETIPTIKAMRGVGQLTNNRGNTAMFRGRQLDASEMTITPGVIDETPTQITVSAEDGSSQTTYQILFAHKASNNAQLAGIKVNGQMVNSFSPYSYDYTAEVEYGSTAAPVITVVKQEDRQTVTFTQPTSLNDVTTITVVAADGTTSKTYTVRYKEATLSDNTLQDIKVNGISIPDFTPTKTNYRVSIPLGTTQMPTVEAISKYPAGMQTIVMTAPSVIEGGVYKIAVTSPGNSSPKEYKLTFALESSSYCKLKDILLDGTSISGFSPDVTTYSVSLPVGTAALPQITYTQGDPYQTISVELGGLDGTTRITVTAANGDKLVYKINFSTAKSTVSTLSGITLNGEMLSGFDPSVTYYTVQLPIGTSELPEIAVVKGDPYEDVMIRTGGLNGKTSITVIAGNGSTTIYQILFSVAQATNATLQGITVGGTALPGFDANTLEYTYELPKGTTELPEVGYIPNDEYQIITTRSGGVNGDYKITVRPQSGTSQVYIIHFSVPKSDNAQLQMIYLDGMPIAGFDPMTFNYTDTLDVNAYPQVTYLSNEGQKVISYLDDNTYIIKVTAESQRSQTYSVKFVVRVSESAFLKMIYLDGDSLAEFSPEQLSYKNIYIQHGSRPQITVSSDEGQQVTILSPAGAGTAQIIVTANGGSHNTYLLELVDTMVTAVSHLDPAVPYLPSHDAALQTILADGTALTDFDSTKTDYTITLAAGTASPVLTFVPNTNKQTVAAGQIANNVYQAQVTAEDGNTRTYTVHITRELYHDAYLKDLQVKGQTIAFSPQTLTYQLSLDEGQTLPLLTYQTASGQTVMMVNNNSTTQQLIVTAEDGTTNTYIITYTRATSSNALLRDIVINEHSIEDFDAHTFHYTYTLPFRTASVPAVNAIGAVNNQIITTCHSAVNGITQIHVEAEDGITTADYTIAFPATLSSNTELSNIVLEAADYTVGEFTFDPDQTDYTVLIPFSATVTPSILFERGEKEQTVTYIARSIGQTSQLIVRAQNGNERTYSITFQRAAAPVPNILKSIIIDELGGPVDMSDPNQREWNIALPYGASKMSVSYVKNYNEQTVLIEAGGLFHPTRLIVLSNNGVQANTTYVLNPIVNTQNPASLTGITIDGAALQDFDPNRFNYIINRDNANTWPEIEVSKAADVSVHQTTNPWESQIIVTAGSYTNTYHIFFHYPNDIIPNGEFDQWTTTRSSDTNKPTGWNVPGDYLDTYASTAKAGNTVSKDGSSAVHLKTTYWGALMGPVPAVMNLGEMSASFAVAGGTRVVPYGSIAYHNSPDYAIINYKYPDKAGNGALFRFKFSDTGSQTYTYDFNATSETSSYNDFFINLGTAGKNILNMDIIMDATGQYPNASSNANLYVDYIRFAYNNTLNGLLVNQSDATLNDKAFSITLDNPEQTDLPQLTFQQGVVDQAQKIDWQSSYTDGGYSIRNATITNYGEDGSYTTYSLEVKRPINTSANLKSIQVEGAELANFKSTTYAYTYLLPYGTTSFPDIMPVLSSRLQSSQVSLVDSMATIVVTAENGTQSTYTIRFTMDAAQATLKNISASNMTPNFSANVFDYTIAGNEWPAILVEKLYDAQSIRMQDGEITVTAANGTTLQYHLHLQPTAPTTSGQLSELELDGNLITDFQSDRYEYALPRPELMNFVRKDASDSVIYIQTPDSLIWQVYGSEYHRYKVIQVGGQPSLTDLKGIYVNGQMLDGFNTQLHDYVLYTDSAVQLSALGMNEHQTIAVDLTDKVYTITVTAQDGTQGTPYIVTLLPTQSSDATLQAIYLDNALLNGFNPSTFTYQVVLPAGTYKQAEPTVPHIGYITTDPKATVEIELGGLNSATKLIVNSSDGTHRNAYELTFTAEPSHNTQLSAIAVNEVPIAEFESGRHYYSAQVAPGEVSFDWRSLDNFQTVSIDTLADNQYALHVVAQDGVNSEDYFLEIFTANLSNDATLADILIDDKPMSEFRVDLNPDLIFNSGLNKYTINIPAHMITLPEVAATLKMDGQSVEMQQTDATVYLKVTAEDGSTNTYILKFVGTLSQNTNLKAIYMDGEPYANFQADQHFYFIDLPNGQHQMPDLIPLKAESAQQWDTASVSLSIGTQMSITVTAEDQVHTSEYVIVFQLHPSDVDTLRMLSGDSLHYQADLFNYYATIPYNAAHQFPDLDWEAGDAYQTILLDTIEHSDYSLTRQLIVTAENGNRNRYTITYSMVPSGVTTLRMIYLNGQDSLPGFVPTTTDYLYTLPVGSTILPHLDADFDAATQSVEVVSISPIVPNAIAATQFIVTAQNGDTRTYTVTLMVAADTTATLRMISYNGQPVPRFDEQIMDYTISYTKKDAELPVITFTKHDELQRVDIIVADSNLVQLHVTAADGISTATYSIAFLPYLSDNGQLEAIYLNDTLLPGFTPIQDAYEIQIATMDDLPQITYARSDSAQQVSVTTSYRYNDDDLPYDVIQTLKVVPENGTDTSYYELVFHIKANTPLRPEQSENALLAALYLRGEVLSQSLGFDQDFSPEIINYYLTYEVGSDLSLFYQSSDVLAIPQDSLATIVGYDTEVKRTAKDTADNELTVATCIHITVKAPAGNLITYNIYQELLLDSANQVTELLVADYMGTLRSLVEFEPGVYYYEYTLSDTRSNAPAFELHYANTESRFACVRLGLGNNSRVVDADDQINYAMDDSEDDPTYHIYYRAENGDKFTYKIKFRRSEIKRAQNPMEGDVLIQHVPGSTQIAVASLRANVVFALYNMAGSMIRTIKLEEGNPNDFETITDGFGQTYFGHVSDFSSCTILTLEANVVYFWAFTENGKRKIKSGKLIIKQ